MKWSVTYICTYLPLCHLVFSIFSCSIPIEDYPYFMCFGYKLPYGHSLAFLFKLRDHAAWLLAYFGDEVILADTVSLGQLENLVGDVIRDDNQ